MPGARQERVRKVRAHDFPPPTQKADPDPAGPKLEPRAEDCSEDLRQADKACVIDYSLQSAVSVECLFVHYSKEHTTHQKEHSKSGAHSNGNVSLMLLVLDFFLLCFLLDFGLRFLAE